ncbi:hypothetical protein TSUD_376000 [Trifolium subterraneum]|uniref:DNA-directed RNA polymerase I subunit rpa49 n=1 Tax=Trifolium subterraneum TaxID=3900 RepID=A0A2Z6N870_TRISU|nr:hypothetical protein TSUD_376000 [Trifolium subterraneum]
MNTEPVNEPAIEPVKAKVEVLSLDPNKTPPCVGYFPSGFDPVKHPGSDGIQVYQHKQKRTELVVSPAGCSVEFVGTSYKGEAAAGHTSMYALGVFDKEAKTLKVMQICGNKILRLEPRVRGLEYMEPPPTETVEELSLEEFHDRHNKLHFTFSTKRTTEMIKKFAEIKRDEEEPEAKQNLDEKMKNVEVKELAIANTEAHITRQIPPYNDSATTPQEAYVLDKIILAGEWNYLQAIYYGLQNGEDFSGYPVFIRNRLDRLKKIEDENEKLKLASILEFITHLVNFKDQHSMDGVSSSKHHKIPHILNHRFNTMFNVGESRRLPSEKINLLHSYVMVLTLFSDKFMTDYTDISKDLRISKISTKQIYEHLGCKFSRQNGAFCATLPVPLTFPKLKSKKRQKKN